ncbi:calmodulin-binding protein 25-like [Argentina anserina]|uniref:calmodulin-binding protein 25-like n=1 Tax=Argentina anserina TaxID=57926 RepID=UPI0021767AE7|nr:calmodulin-binding protein 25-like [Potentilla anserina]
MAASDNLAAMEPWVYRPTTNSTFADSWISGAFARDSKALTMALQKSLMGNKSSESAADSEFLPFFDTFQPEATPTPTVSGVTGSDPESCVAAPTKRQRSAAPVSGGKVAKRKSRASKRTQTTFITADPANFRQMVQQVTGVRFSNGDGNGNGQQFSSSLGSNIVKPAPQRFGTGGCLPTLDTSAFLFDRHQQQSQQYQQQKGVGPAAVMGGGGGVVGQMCYGGNVEVAEGGGVSGGRLGFDSYSSFPTLESWKVM